MKIFKNIKEIKIGTLTFLISHYVVTIIIGILYTSESSNLLKSITLVMLTIALCCIFLLWLVSKIFDQKNGKLRAIDFLSLYFSFFILSLLSIGGGIISYLSLPMLGIIILLQVTMYCKLMIERFRKIYHK